MNRNEKLDLIHKIISEAGQQDLFKVAEKKNSIVVSSFDYDSYGDIYQTGWVIFADADTEEETSVRFDVLRDKTMWNHSKKELV